MNSTSILKNSRRAFIKKTVAASSLVAAGRALPGWSAASYRRIIGANELFRVSIMGVNSRGAALGATFANQPNCDLIHVCDVDSRALASFRKTISGIQAAPTKGFKDFRLSLESKDIDALVISAPDHWHAPAALMAMKAGKHVYLEKPCSHNPHEGEIIVEAATKYNRKVQMGNQRRSYPHVVQGIEELQSGAIGRVYIGKGWYTNNRASIGIGKETAVPDWLDWNLWQGPAPRSAFKDNVVHYNWHWFWHWGTGEALNNGTHMIDLLRWGMKADFPVKVSSNGGRYRYKDDWQTPDTQVINLDFKEGMSMTWEGRSCNGRYIEGSSVGVEFYGEKGSLFMDGGDSYTLYDLNNKVIKEVKPSQQSDPRNVANPSEYLDGLHVQNFFQSINGKESLHSDIDSGYKSTLLMQLGNIAYRMGHSLDIDPLNGHILNDSAAMKLWSRAYEPGWEMKL
ncbi:MAG: Gfo/Idh/MocA family oxidoreductase [Saprospiraceae bacterium]|jgi:predicted dehydrogenase|nr:Gfo/Idh/MocA family oxidoreductase [Saprospiraceae bacterium]MBK6480101.1 Gfo/Idh/MocA family oxidoreductase [Saprospiraceae bacterium]MBK7372086.1 Gfo/Idh/MocA family oxidoreductase [Saprospiraceae bacterium]MBK7435454.1 Gfo/Idh/MocA family oxidoreductase [Saprospiraceae bacterium]MBK9681120.1 Gfo/Idh/MocA family oxidoreductase [Saprospiraceae bacterium]